MKTKMKLITLVLALVLASCSSKLQQSYGCECKDLWSKIKGHKFEDFEKDWGHYIDKEENFSEKKVGYKYRITYSCDGSSKCGEIWIWFDALRQDGSSELISFGTITHSYCYGPGSDSPRLVNE
jgi:hypothetical protein